MRRAEEPQFWTVGFELIFNQIKIQLIAVFLHGQRVSKHPHALALCRHRKRIVDRRVHHHAIARRAERLDRVMQRGDGAVGQGEPRLLHLNLMTRALEGHHRVVKFVEAPGIAKGAVLHDALEAFNNGRRRGEVHVCDPQRDKPLRDITKA